MVYFSRKGDDSHARDSCNDLMGGLDSPRALHGGGIPARQRGPLHIPPCSGPGWCWQLLCLQAGRSGRWQSSPRPCPRNSCWKNKNPRIGFPIQRFCSSVDHLICRKSGVLVCTLGHTADLARSGVLLDDTLSASLVDRGNSSQDSCVLVSGFSIDGSVCLLDDCFQVGLNGLVVSCSAAACTTRSF